VTSTLDRPTSDIEVLPDPLAPRPAPPVAESTPEAEPSAPRRRPVRRAVAVVTWVAVGFVFWSVFLSALPYARHQRSLDRRLRSELSQGLGPVNQPVPAGAPVARLQAPAIGLDATVVEGSTARQLVAGPGHLRSSPFPGQAGVSVVLGRRITQGGPFRHLDQLRRGDRIRVTNGQGIYTYRVSGPGRLVPAADASAFAGRGNSILLVTSEASVSPHARFVVTARATEDLAPSGTPSTAGAVTGAELGLQGDATSATGLLVWLQIAVLVAAAAVVLHRRWGRWPTWLLAAPLLAAALWGFYEQLALLLPATL